MVDAESPFERAIRESTNRYIGVVQPAPQRIIVPPSLEVRAHEEYTPAPLIRTDGWDNSKQAKLAGGRRMFDFNENDRLAIKRMAGDNLVGPRHVEGLVFAISVSAQGPCR